MASIFIESLYLKSKTNKACKSSKVHQGSEWSLPPVTLKGCLSCSQICQLHIILLALDNANLF